MENYGVDMPPERPFEPEPPEPLTTSWPEIPPWPDEEAREAGEAVEEEWWPDEEQQAAEEWSSGMLRPRPEPERPELEAEPIGITEQEPLVEPLEGEEESLYGI
jgi:hypothetical protein